MHQFQVTRLSQDYVYSNDQLFNTNNLWSVQGLPRPDDYQQKRDSTQTHRWAPPDTLYLTLDTEDTRWMIKASSTVGMFTGKHSHLFDDERDRTVARHAASFPEISSGSPGWFVRTESVSLKGGQHGIGPYTNLKDVVESLVSSYVGHMCINADDKNLDAFKVYFFPWRNIAQEFRVFVHNNRISAISTQKFSEVNEWLYSLSDEEVGREVGQKIIDHFNATLRDKLAVIAGPDYSMDIAFLDDGSVFFIEPNSFGANYAAGSASFHWVYEHDSLHGEEGDMVEIKFTDRE